MLLSTDETVGYKVMDTTAQVAYDIQNRSGLMNRSQWRLRFAKNAPVQAYQHLLLQRLGYGCGYAS